MTREIYLAESAGYCFGVKMALDKAEELAQTRGQVHTHGPLIHNPQKVKELEQKGVTAVESVADVPSGILLIRAHGVPPTVIEEAKAKKLTVVDATCPLVTHIQQTAKELEDKGFQVLMFGERSHPEAIGVKGHTQKLIIVETVEEVKRLGLYRKLALISQSTQPVDEFNKIVQEAVLHCDLHLEVRNTICEPTRRRQEAALELAEKVDLMVVIGGYNSGNTQRLYRLCKDKVTAYHIETAEELRPEWLTGRTKIGVTAGASTPHETIEKVIKGLQTL